MMSTLPRFAAYYLLIWTYTSAIRNFEDLNERIARSNETNLVFGGSSLLEHAQEVWSRITAGAKLTRIGASHPSLELPESVGPSVEAALQSVGEAKDKMAGLAGLVSTSDVFMPGLDGVTGFLESAANAAIEGWGVIHGHISVVMEFAHEHGIANLLDTTLNMDDVTDVMSKPSECMRLLSEILGISLEALPFASVFQGVVDVMKSLWPAALQLESVKEAIGDFDLCVPCLADEASELLGSLQEASGTVKHVKGLLDAQLEGSSLIQSASSELARRSQLQSVFELFKQLGAAWSALKGSDGSGSGIMTRAMSALAILRKAFGLRSSSYAALPASCFLMLLLSINSP
eukprot:TRINITY_DN23528_c0_g6_i1.p1 TRINITY_DN23528_c0_g6~~TRINITY_DN23528_c0_g6_i1.p1  ORF type:complete len:346 (-),score=59.35 TRINITY_DN23528_c0_g6_i1:70-1107(-)